jgi:hypothetical protein
VITVLGGFVHFVIDRCNLCGSSRLGSLPHPLTRFLCFSSENHSFSPIPFLPHHVLDLKCGHVIGRVDVIDDV